MRKILTGSLCFCQWELCEWYTINACNFGMTIAIHQTQLLKIKGKLTLMHGSTHEGRFACFFRLGKTKTGCVPASSQAVIGPVVTTRSTGELRCGLTSKTLHCSPHRNVYVTATLIFGEDADQKRFSDPSLRLVSRRIVAAGDANSTPVKFAQRTHTDLDATSKNIRKEVPPTGRKINPTQKTRFAC